MRDFEKEPLVLDKVKNKLEDLSYEDLVNLLNKYNLTQIKTLLKVSDNYIYRQLKLHNLSKIRDGRKNENKLTKEEYEIQKYGQIGLSRSEKLNITIEKFGKEVFWKNHTNKVKEAWNSHTKEFEQKRLAKIKATKLQKYGDENFTNQEKRKKTNLEKYGIATRIIDKDILTKTHSKEIIDKMNKSRSITWENKSKEEKKEIYKKVVAQAYLTKKLNNTFNTSKPEKEIKRLLEAKFSKVIGQYKSELYPFKCDFYIPSLDLYIEYQGTWTHGGHPFTESKDDLEVIQIWKSKNTKYYNGAIKVWTEKDPLKRQTAIKNNLNWLEFFTFEDFLKWYNGL